MEAHLRAGIAIYNAGGYHAAHDAWEDHWLALETGTDDEQFLHGLIQFTAAVYHARDGNWSGATGLAESAGDYLADLPAHYRGMNVDEVRAYLAALARDPEIIERAHSPWLTHEGDRLTFDDLDLASTAVVATVLAEELDYDEATVERAAEFGRADLDAGETGDPFVPLLFDFVREPENREIIYQRLSEHVRRRKSREEDVEGLFE
jgi:predicted metal-dependent hydrolase